MLRVRLIRAEPIVWPPARGQCPLCGLTDPPPSPATRYRGKPAHTTCLARAFPHAPLLTDLGVRLGGVVPRGWAYVAHIYSITDGVAHARALASCRRDDIRPGTVLLVAHRFGEVVEAVAFRGDPVESMGSFQIPLIHPWELGPGDWGRVYIRRVRAR